MDPTQPQSSFIIGSISSLDTLPRDSRPEMQHPGPPPRNHPRPRQRAVQPEDFRRRRTLKKWSKDEDTTVIRSRASGMKWNAISKELPDRSTISARLHYANYLERGRFWGDEQRNKLAKIYSRLNFDMWNLVAKELDIPWRACEELHWEMGKEEMTRRAQEVPFDTTAVHAQRGEQSCQVAQRGRMLAASGVSEGQGFQSLYSTFDSNDHSHDPYTYLGNFSQAPPSNHPVKREKEDKLRLMSIKELLAPN